MTDNLTQLLATPLQLLREDWRSETQQETLRAARTLHEQSPDAYWAWAAEQQRWTNRWSAVRTGELGDFTYFDGGTMNVADNWSTGGPRTRRPRTRRRSCGRASPVTPAASPTPTSPTRCGGCPARSRNSA